MIVMNQAEGKDHDKFTGKKYRPESWNPSDFRGGFLWGTLSENQDGMVWIGLEVQRNAFPVPEGGIVLQ